MKKVFNKDLEIGKIYKDTEGPLATELRFVGYNEKSEPVFKYHSGIESYGSHSDEDIDIPFMNIPEDYWFEVE